MFHILKNIKIIKTMQALSIFVGLFFLTAPNTHADTSLLPGKFKNQNKKIQITGDVLNSNSKMKYAEFKGNVVATQGDFKIQSDVLRIYYKGDLNLKKKSESGEETLDRLIASGNVKMWFKIMSDNDYAETQKAEYLVDDMVLTLTGANSKIVSDKNSVTGPRIVLNMSTGQYKLEGKKNERVTLTLYPEDEDKKKKNKENQKSQTKD